MGGEKKKWLPTIVMMIFGIIFVMPILLLVMNSFKPYNDMIQNFLSFPKSLYLGNYVTAMKRMDFFRVFFNSAVITGGTVVVCVLVSFMAAYGIAHMKGKVSTGFYLLFTLGQIVPFHTIMIALSVMTTKLNMNNSFLVLIFLIEPDYLQRKWFSSCEKTKKEPGFSTPPIRMFTKIIIV